MSSPSDTTQGLVIAVKGHSGIVRPRDLEAANKKRPHSLGLTQATSVPTHVTTLATEVQETIVAKEDEDDIDDDILQKVFVRRLEYSVEGFLVFKSFLGSLSASTISV
ncbi:hypothetical protein QL285_001688 [Trifolium repens]|nr:hypothetical protein QL285_001688 [Trifolium repens]